jgi:hypothetical protein
MKASTRASYIGSAIGRGEARQIFANSCERWRSPLMFGRNNGRIFEHPQALRPLRGRTGPRQRRIWTNVPKRSHCECERCLPAQTDCLNLFSQSALLPTNRRVAPRTQFPSSCPVQPAMSSCSFHRGSRCRLSRRNQSRTSVHPSGRAPDRFPPSDG